MPLPLKAFVILIVLFLCLPANSQPKCTVVNYSTEDGLLDNRVTCIARDQEGFMWFGTYAGLNRFDGHTFKSYRSQPGDRSELSNNRFEKIVDDHAGYLWLLSRDARVYRFDKKHEEFLAVKEVIKNVMPDKTEFEEMIPSENGDIWLRTKDYGVFRMRSHVSGLPVYEQYAMEAITSHRIPSNDIQLFYPNKKGQLWIGTGKGLALFMRQPSGCYQAVPLPALPVPAGLKKIAESGNDFWFAGENGYLVCYSGTTHQFTAHKIAGQEINDLYVSAKEHSLYCITAGNTLLRFDLSSHAVNKYVMEGDKKFASITGDRTGNIWIEPEQPGIILFDPVTKIFKTFTPKSIANFNSFKGFKTFEDRMGRFWAIMKSSGLGYYDTATHSMAYFYNDPADPLRLFPNSVNEIFYDPDGVMWFTTNEGGLHQVIFTENSFDQKLLSQTPERPFNEVRSVYTDHRNRLWQGTKAGGLYVVEGNQQINIEIKNIPADGLGQVYCIMEDRRNNVWLGTSNNGLYKAVPLDQGGIHYRLEHFQPGFGDSAMKAKRISALLEDARGRIWIGTFSNGLNLVMEKDNNTYFLNRDNGLKNYPKNGFGGIRHLALDGTGRLWIATTAGLLIMDDDSRIEQANFQQFRSIAGDKNSLSDNDIQFICKDLKNNMWLATSGGGINKAIGSDLGSMRFHNYTTRDGLAGNYVVSCIPDNNGNLWLATTNGLSRFNGETFRNFHSYDGITAKGFSESACTKLLNGDLVFGTYNGYLVFSPSKIKDHKVNATLALTRLQVNNTDIGTHDSTSILPQSINTIQSLTLRYNQNIVSIDYAILDYRFQDNDLYAYRLTGFDDTWHNDNNVRRASYTNLPPGKYTFEVKNLNNDRYSNVPTAKLDITILPPPWRTWWAYLLYILTAGILLAIIYRTLKTMLRLRQRIAVEQKLTDLKRRFYTNISHELRTPLTLIQGPIDSIAKTEALSANGQNNVNTVRKNVARITRFINQLLDLGKLQSGTAMLHISHVEIALLARQVTEYFSGALKQKGMRVLINTTAKDPYAWVDAEKIETVIYNLLANALKFGARGSNICINIQQGDDADSLTIDVVDEGPGVDDTELEDIFRLYYEGRQPQKQFLKGTGIGLSLSKEIIDLHHGKIYAKNNLTRGLTVAIELKKSRDHFSVSEATVIADESIVKKDQVISAAMPTSEQSLVSDQKEMQLVLVVEDNAELSDFLSEQLQTSYQVAVAGDGQQGLEKALHLLPDLIVSDIMMPNMDGIAMLDALKKNPATSHIPVVLLSAKYDIESQIEGLRYGADYYITKPFDTDFLKASVSNLLEQRRKLFHQLQHNIQPGPQPTATLITAHDEDLLKKVIRFVEDGMQESDFDIDSIAMAMAMSRSSFYKKFKSLTNMAPLEFVNEMRMKKAREMFDNGEQNVSRVSGLVGFSSPQYFSTSFRKYYGKSPSEYLKADGNDIK